MTRLRFCLALLLSLLASGPGAGAAELAKLPLDIAGVRLGAYIHHMEPQCSGDTAVPLRDAPFLTEVSLKPSTLPGVRGASVAYGNCADPGRIVWVKIKFRDMRRELFDQLYDRYEDRFGKPSVWLGDAFHNVIAWAWDFTDGAEQMRVVLMYSKDRDMRPGVSIKATLRSAYDREYECYHARLVKEDARTADKDAADGDFDLDHYVPKAP